MNKKYKRQLSWCKRHYPIGSLVKYNTRGGYPLCDIEVKYSIVVGYFYENLGMSMYLKVIESGGYKMVNPGNAKRLQRLYSSF